jgi:hypothetical protein
MPVNRLETSGVIDKLIAMLWLQAVPDLVGSIVNVLNCATVLFSTRHIGTDWITGILGV